MNKQIFKKIFSNGLTVLVYPVSIIPKVAVQLWYNVGSKDELDGQRGLAHLLEHMTFKGTKKLSESDINLITHRLSGYCNAFTSHDYTCYVFDMPKHHWPVALTMLSDCMTNCTFKSDLLNTEVKAVVQELKMYRDDYGTTLIEHMIGSIFRYHPYHYPIIGYKQDLWKISREGLFEFYQKHYVPNNATLVIVGDVDVDEAFELAHNAFDSIAKDVTYEKKEAPVYKDLLAQSVTLYRSVMQPTLMLGWVIPGLKADQDYLTDVINWALADGRGSRLFRLLVEETKLATDVSSTLYDLYDATVWFVSITPSDTCAIDRIIALVKEELQKIEKDGLSDHEIKRAMAQTEMDYLATFDSISKTAYAVGRAYMATGNEKSFFEYIPQTDVATVKKQVADFLRAHFSSYLMHVGKLLPLPVQERERWVQMQEEADEYDETLVRGRDRQTPVEEGVHVHEVEVKNAQPFVFPKAQKTILANGLKVLWHPTTQNDKIEIILDLKAKHFYDPEGKEGIGNFVSEMILEGTKKYTSHQLTDLLESRGMSLGAQPGVIAMTLPAKELEFALEVIHEVLTNATFNDDAIEKIRAQIIIDIDLFWDSAFDFVGQLAKEAVYKGHPYSKSPIGTHKSIRAITKKDLIDYYHTYYTPDQATIVLVGALSEVPGVIEKYLGAWQGKPVEKISFVQLTPPDAQKVMYPLARDQVVLCYTGLSVDRSDADFDALLLFDQIFTGGALGSMSSRLFQLREQTGLFYTIGGSLVANADEQKGIVFIRTIVSLDDVEKAQQMIAHEMAHATDSLSEEDLAHARSSLAIALVDNFESNIMMAEMFLFLERFNFPANYLDKRIEQLSKVTIDQVKSAVKKVLDPKHLVTISVGRIEK